MFGRVVVRYLVKDLGIRLERAKPVREANRDQKLIPIRRADDSRNMLAVGRRATTEVHSDVENGPANYPHELDMREWRYLEMQSPYHSAFG